PNLKLTHYATDSIASSLLNPAHDLRDEAARCEAVAAREQSVSEAGDDDCLSRKHSAVAFDCDGARVHDVRVEELRLRHPCGGDEARFRRAGAERGDANARAARLVRERLGE